MNELSFSVLHLKLFGITLQLFVCFYYRTIGAIPLSYVGALPDTTPEYEDIEKYQLQDPLKSASELGDFKTATCPAYQPTMHQNQAPTVADTYEQLQYEDVAAMPV